MSAQVIGDQFLQRDARRIAQIEGLDHRLNNPIRVIQRGELDQPDAVFERRQHVGAKLQRQARLAGAAGAGQRQQMRPRQQFPDIRQLVLAPDEAGQLNGQVIRVAVERAERRKGGRQRRMRPPEKCAPGGSGL